VESMPPPIIQPLTRPAWKYVSPAGLATSGIYSSEDLDRLRDHIMFPVEKPQMLNTIARGAMGQDLPPGSVSMMNLFDDQTLEKIAESAGARLWRGFITFGSASAGVLAIFILIRLIKLIVDTIIHGYALRVRMELTPDWRCLELRHPPSVTPGKAYPEETTTRKTRQGGSYAFGLPLNIGRSSIIPFSTGHRRKRE